MGNPSTIRLLAAKNNERGDLFTRLAGDLFFALGYDDLRFDVHKSGREIDIQGSHRLLPRRLVVECKAQARKMGGTALNKFFGVVSQERSENRQTPVDGYFVSLNGFTETGIEQVQRANEQDRIVLLDGQQVIDELNRIGIVISHADAAEQAGRCAEHALLNDAVPDGAQLLGHHPLGYLWAMFYSQSKQRTHFALVHADGTPLAEPVALEVIQADRKCKGSLYKLKYLPPPGPDPDRETVARSAVDRYRQWIVTECGDIQLDGLPADADLAAFHIKLERLFVPLKIVSTIQPPDDESPNQAGEESVTLFGRFLDQHPRFSLLAKPGGGKSTLLKRLAVAYADPERRYESDDQLPNRDWLPLMLTTLLVVKRNVGELPTRRVRLYKAAIDVLIRTWNVEGYEPLDEEETLAQLSYVACAMMHDGQQRIVRRRLLELLNQARGELEAELQFAAISPSQFIGRIEYRSSLLMRAGHEVLDDELQEVYEFRHLTFQEYLTARGLIEEQYPGRGEPQSIADLLEPYFEDERWRETIPLAAVLGGRKSEELVRRLIASCENLEVKDSIPVETVTSPAVSILRQCLVDEVQVTPGTVRLALQQMGRHGNEDATTGSVVGLLGCKFSNVFRETVFEEFLRGETTSRSYRTAACDIAIHDRRMAIESEVASDEALMQSWIDDLKSDDAQKQISALMECSWMAFQSRGEDAPPFAMWPNLVSVLTDVILRENTAPLIRTEACSAYVWGSLWPGDQLGRGDIMRIAVDHLSVEASGHWQCIDRMLDECLSRGPRVLPSGAAVATRFRRAFAHWAFDFRVTREVRYGEPWFRREYDYPAWGGAVIFDGRRSASPTRLNRRRESGHY